MMPLPRSLEGGQASKSAVAETVGGAILPLDKARLGEVLFAAGQSSMMYPNFVYFVYH